LLALLPGVPPQSPSSCGGPGGGGPGGAGPGGAGPAGGSPGSGGSGSGSPGDPAGGEPVDLATGLFEYTKTDLMLADVLPASVVRTYRQGDSVSKAFGIGTSNLFDIFLTG